MTMAKGFSMFVAAIMLIVWFAIALLINLPAPSTTQGLMVLPYTIIYFLLLIPKALITGMLNLL
jgi:hypothetical protein